MQNDRTDPFGECFASSDLGGTSPRKITEDDIGYINFLYAQSEAEAWIRQQRAKAPVMFHLLRQHLPGEVLQEFVDYLIDHDGCESFSIFLQQVNVGESCPDLVSTPEQRCIGAPE